MYNFINYLIGAYNQVPPQTWPTLGASLMTVVGTFGGKKLVKTLLDLESAPATAMIFGGVLYLCNAWAYGTYYPKNSLTWVAYGLLLTLAMATTIFHFGKKTNLSQYQVVVKKTASSNELLPTPDFILPPIQPSNPIDNVPVGLSPSEPPIKDFDF